MKKTLCILIAVFMLIQIPFLFVSAEDEILLTTQGAVEPNEIPLLIISASFDANGNGKNDYVSGNSGKLFKNPADDFFGEQWAEVSAEQYLGIYFNDKYSVSNYFKELTMNKLYFVPAKIDVPKENKQSGDGWINVVVDQIHPSAYNKKFPGQPTASYQAFCTRTIDDIIKQTDDYIDYAKFDKDGDGNLSSYELVIVIMNAGLSAEKQGGKLENASYPRGYFSVWGTSQGTNVDLDGLTYSDAVSNIGEYLTAGVLQSVGTPCHEIAHNLGAEDIYDRKVGASGTAKNPWPFANWFSLQCSGNYSGGGRTPTYLDPYQRVKLGWAEEVVVGEGEYTLYSTLTGKYQVLRVNTPDPDEYYLIELRLKEGFEINLTGEGRGTGGICVWHIDESVNRSYYAQGTACSNYKFNGAYHNPGIMYLYSANNTIGGKMVSFTSQTLKDPFFYAGAAKESNQKFESMDYKAPLDYTPGLYSYPSGWIGEEYWNLIIEPLSPAGQEMKIKISIDAKGTVAPQLTVSSTKKTGTTITMSGTVAQTDLDVVEYGFMLASNAEFTENVVKMPLEKGSDSVTFTGLTPDTAYRGRMYAVLEGGTDVVIERTEMYSTTQLLRTSKFSSVLVPDCETVEEMQKVKYGEAYTVPTPVEKEGYTFDGWFADEAFTVPFDFEAPATIDGEVNIYAKWKSLTPAPTEEPTAAPTDGLGTGEPTASGCSSSISFIAPVIVTVIAGAAVIKKKKD